SSTFVNRVLHRGYGVLVRFAMAQKWVIVVLATACLLLIPALFKAVGKDFLPLDDRGEFNVVVQTPPGSTLAESDRYLRELEGRIGKLPHVRHLLTTIGDTGIGNQDVTQATLYVGLDPLDQRKQLSQFAIMKQARRVLADYPELRAAVQPINDIQQGGAANYQFNYAIQGPDLDKLNQLAALVMARMQKEPGFVDVDTASAQRKPELRVYID